MPPGPRCQRCGIQGVLRSAYCRMIGRPESERIDPITNDVHAVWRDDHELYGACKIKVSFVK